MPEHGWLSPEGIFHSVTMGHAEYAFWELKHGERELERMGWIKVKGDQVLNKNMMTQAQINWLFDHGLWRSEWGTIECR